MDATDDDEYELLPPTRPTSPPPPPKPLPRLWKLEQEAAEAGSEGVQAGGPPLSPAKAKGPANPGSNPAPPARPRQADASRPGGSAGPTRPAASQPAQPKPAPPKAALSRRERERERLEAEAEQPKRKGVLIEETPEFDTFDARQRVRTIVALTLLAGAAVGILMLVLPYLSSGQENIEDLPDEGKITQVDTARPREDASEVEAKNMFENARLLAKNGKVNDAVAMLKKVSTSYPKSKTAAAARDALARPSQNPPLPLFLDEDKTTLVASSVAAGNSAPPVASGGEGPAVAAVDTVAGKTMRPGQSDAQLQLPANPDEAGARPGVAGSSGEAAGTVPVRSLPPGFHVLPESSVHKSGWPTLIAADRDGAPMVFIPGGPFRMGRDDGGPEEGPTHVVNLSPYYIDQHEATVRMFNLYAKETGAKAVTAASLKKDGVATDFTADHPIVLVSARDATNYCEWAGKKLPTEAQWEKAARTTDGRPFPWGAAEPTWVRPRQSKQIDVVMSYELDQSPYGVFDMAGNAWEWTADYFDANYFKQFRTSPPLNPVGPAPKGRNPQLVLKGGSKTWHVTWREGLKPETRYPFVGFRGVLTVEDGGEAPAPAPSAPASSGPATPRPGPQPAGKTRQAPTSGVVPF